MGRNDDSSCLQESRPAITDSVATTRQAIVDFAAAAGARDQQLDDIRLASSEALSNIVQHAYPGRSGQIHTTARVAAGELWVLIADDGCGLRAGRESDGLGLGLGLIAQVTDEFTVLDRGAGGTELRLRFVLRADGSGRDQDRGSVSSATRAATSRFSTIR
ncbi:MAG: ATP-binding protein [Solirubrobacterales bacterium]|nr:ATP-binding protein [Solirubrobacterales bacterium]